MKNPWTRLIYTTLIATLCFAASADMHGDRIAQMQALLSDETRPEADKARDEGRKPARVIAFLGIEPGMTVLDMLASGGYYTEVLSKAVGEDGKVISQNNPRVLQMRDGAADKALTARLKGGRLANVERMDIGLRELSLEPGSLDAAMFILNFHDVYNNSPEVAVGLLRQIASYLKPNGFIGVIDHVGAPGNDNAGLHRVDPAAVRDAIDKAGLTIAAESDILSNPGDDHSKMVFAPDLRGHTDRFLFKVVKAQ